MNVFTFIGRVGRDAETRHVGDTQQPVTSFPVAVDSGFGKNKQTLWLDCSLWGERGTKVGEFIKKGAQLGVTGELGQRQGTGDHQDKTFLTLRVAEVSLIGGKKEAAQ